MGGLGRRVRRGRSLAVSAPSTFAAESAFAIRPVILEYFAENANVRYHGDALVVEVDFLVLQFPGVRMGDENRAQTRAQGRVDVGAGAVADHERARALESGGFDQPPVGRFVLFRRHFDVAEMAPQPRAVKFAHLLARVPLGEEDQMMARGEFSQCLRDVGQQCAFARKKILGNTLDRRDDRGATSATTVRISTTNGSRP